jgi:hypothetical protein
MKIRVIENGKIRTKNSRTEYYTQIVRRHKALATHFPLFH